MRTKLFRRPTLLFLAGFIASLSSLPLVWALRPPQETGRFGHLVKADPSSGMALRGVSPAALPADASARRGWEGFLAEQKEGWSGWFDLRSGLPTLVQGRGIAWSPGPGNSLKGTPLDLAGMETLARDFVQKHSLLFGNETGSLVLDREASGPLGPGVWQITFHQVVDGVRVDGSRVDFHVAGGNLVAFGTEKLVPVLTSTTPALSAAQARAALDQYLGSAAPGNLVEREPSRLHLIVLDPRGTGEQNWDGPTGAGYAHALCWRFLLSVPGEPPTWVAEVDAHSGTVVALYDDTRYERIKGGVYPVSDDQICPTGCEQPDFPMPFVDYRENDGATQYSGDQGLYQCTTIGATMHTTLIGPYIKVHDNCGAIDETTTCDNDLDLRLGPGTDCEVPAGSSAGNTHSARSSFYHLNRSMEKGRAWLPNNNWLKQQLTDNVNINATCNAYWSGSVNFYKSGGGCRNTGEIAGVFVHEWGHGIDQNDGGGYDNPSEAYADVVAFFETRESCIGRGFYMSQNCDGYGNACLNCTGIRDQDWDMRADHTPSTPGGFIQNDCYGGGGPCGKEEHCESYLAGETIWDLAVRDLPAAGLDTASAWQLAEKMFYRSRAGSGGNAYNCSGGVGDGCGTSSWFHKFRLIDDDDGNLANGTPHGAAIFNAFNRHQIACGNAGDASNQNTTSCPALAAPDIAVTAGSNSNTLSWNPVAGAASYTILRNDLGCERSQIIIDKADAPATSYLDDQVPNGYTLYYRVQAVGSNPACDSPVSECVSSAAQPFAGTVKFEQVTYGCSTAVRARVVDGNAGGGPITVSVSSTSEPVPELVTLTPVAPGSAKYTGSIPSTSGPAVSGDGLLSLAHGDVLTVEYIDVDDGTGGVNISRLDHASGDCIYPIVTNVRDMNVTDTAATILWNTDELSDSVLVWGPVKPPANNGLGNSNTLTHQVGLSGLQQCTVYYYEAHSTDAAGNIAVANNGGSYYHFETQGLFNGTMQPCHQGRVTLNKDVLACADTVTVSLVDMDLNLDSNQTDTAVVALSSNTEPVPERLVLTETSPNSSTFQGSIQVAQGTPVNGDGIVQLKNGDTLTVSYQDANDGTGSARVSFDTAADDCLGPDINPVQVTDITDESSKVRFTTSEPSTARLDWGLTSALGNVLTDSVLATSHTFSLAPLNECGRVYFRITATDVYGNTRIIDASGAPFAFNAGMIPGFFRDGFETSTGWTLGGEWQIAAPQGLGTSPADPTAAFSGTKILGHDLTGLGSHPGDYERGVTENATSPTINATGQTGVTLKFRRWLNSGGGGISFIKIKSGSVWHEVWRSDSVSGVSESTWSLQVVDLSTYGNNNSSMQIRFEQFGGPGTAGGNRSGWNIDRVVVKNGTTPDWDACGSCGGAPTFGGLVSGVDADPCGATGTVLTWKAAPAWGTGRGGTYTVYRDTLPNFTPSSSNRVAAGVTGTSYADTTAPEGATLYYLVRAENDETCSTGPNNHGVPDGNTEYRTVVTTSSRPVPAAQNTLLVDRVNPANLRLIWQVLPLADLYRVYRSIIPQPGGFGLLGATSGLFLDDVGAGANRENYYYLVRGANACGTEGP